jgi:endonuclease-3 related protein
MSIIRKIYDTLREHYDTQPIVNSWLDNSTEVIIGAILAQGTTWKIVVKILDLLRARSLLSFRAIADADDKLLSNLISSAGFQIKKTKRLKDIAELFLSCGNGNVNTFFARDIDQVRQELLKVQGMNPGTVDNIILYAGKLPIYVVDTYTMRIFLRHEIVPSDTNSADIQQLIHFELTPDEEPYGAELFSEFQTFMIKLGKTCCGIPQPDCSHCPLAVLLPATGARNINIPDEVTIQTVPVILAKKLKLKPDRPKIPELTPTQLQSTLLATKKQTTTKKSPQPQQKIIPQNTNPHTVNKPIAVKQDQPQQKSTAELKLNDTEKLIVEQIGYEPTQIDLLVQSTKLPIHVVRATIAVLEMRKILRQVEGNRVERQ